MSVTTNIPPEELITEILAHLPVKSLLRFRCVSKPWKSLIGSKHFVKMHLNHSSSRSLLIGDAVLDVFFVDLDTFEQQLDFGQCPFNRQWIPISCNGLVFAVSPVPNEPLLWNPSTRRYKKLPHTEYEFPLKEDEVLEEIFVNDKYGFGYDSKSDDYKVVRVTEFDKNGVYLLSQTKIYSLRTNTWKLVELDFPYRFSNAGKMIWGAYLNDALHTVVVRHDNYGLKIIMAFDLSTMELYEVPKPDLTGENYKGGVDCVEVVGGLLTAVFPCEMNVSEIWVMKEYMVKESWTKLFCFESPLFESYMDVTPLAYSRRGDEMYLNYDWRCIFGYSLRTNCTRIVSTLFDDIYRSRSSTFWAVGYVGSLVSLDSPDQAVVSTDEKQNEQEKKGKQSKKKKKNRDDFLAAGFKLKL